MANINFPVPEEVHKKLKLEAIHKDSTLRELIISKLDAYRKKNEKNK